MNQGLMLKVGVLVGLLVTVGMLAYAQEEKPQPVFGNMDMEVQREKLTAGSEYTDIDLVQKYTLYDVHAGCNYDDKGVARWRNLNPGTKGTCFTGPIQSPTTSIVDRVETSATGSLLLHLAPGSYYFPRPQEVTAITNSFRSTSLGEGRTGCLVKDSQGKEIARLYLEKRKVVVAGPQGMCVKVDLMSGKLDIAEALRSAAGVVSKR